MVLNIKYLLIALCILFNFIGNGQNNTQKIKHAFNLKNYSLTIEEVNLASSMEINYDSLLYLKAYSHIKLNQLKEADITISKLEKINSTYYEVYFLKGLILATKKNYPDAIINFNKVVEINPTHDKALYNMALSKGLLEDYLGAIKDLDKCILTNPNYALAFYNRGYWQELSENYVAAIKDYKAAIVIDNHYSEAYLALAYAYSQNGDMTLACETLKQAKDEGVEAAQDLIQNFCK